MTLIPYIQLVKIPAVFYKMLGQDIFEPMKGSPNAAAANIQSYSKYLRILFCMGLINYLMQWSLQIAFLVVSIQSSLLLEAAAIIPSVGFGFVGLFKQLTLHWNKWKIRGVLDELEDLYPKTNRLQEEYNLKKYLFTLNFVMRVFSGLCILNTVYFTFFSLVKSIFAMLFDGAQYDFPIFLKMWYPFNERKNWGVYILCNCLQVWAGISAGIAVLSADLFLVTSVTQLCIQFDYISNKLRNYEPKSEMADLEFLSGILKLHVKCLNLSKTVDDVFSLSLLWNFLTSSGNICFGGFHMMSSSTEDLLRFGVLLGTSLAQVWIICVYGNKLINASLAVGDAAYTHPWYKCDLAYKNMIKLIICRSQRYAAIHAPTFPSISLQTFMKVISMSYQFFAVLQTTNDK